MLKLICEGRSVKVSTLITFHRRYRPICLAYLPDQHGSPGEFPDVYSATT